MIKSEQYNKSFEHGQQVTFIKTGRKVGTVVGINRHQQILVQTRRSSVPVAYHPNNLK